MEHSRPERYRQKMQVVVTRLESVPKTIKTEIEVNAMLYCVQVAIDAAMDIAAMLVKDIGHEVSDDYHNIDALVKRKIFPAALGEELKRLNGLRNAIMHKYNTFEEETVVEHIQDIKKTVGQFLDKVEEKLHALP